MGRRGGRAAAGHRLGRRLEQREFWRACLFLVIFLWTPPHFWSLALRRSADYERVGVPMLPNVVGPAETCRQIAIYAAMLVAASFAPLIIPRVGLAYGLVAAALDAALMWRVIKLYWLRNGPEAEQRKVALGLFGFSILYLFALFVALGVTAIAFYRVRELSAPSLRPADLIRGEAIQSQVTRPLDRFVASLLAMTVRGHRRKLGCQSRLPCAVALIMYVTVSNRD